MKKLIAIILALCLLTGCQLASEKPADTTMEDKLVGVFITFDHLDLDFDMEVWLQDNSGALEDGEEILLEPDEGKQYEEKLWATVTKEGWSFPGCEGLIMGQMWKTDHWVGFATEGLCNLKTSVERTDTHDGITEEGTIYVPWGTEVMFCPNPVYMTPDGRYYAVQGSAFHSMMEGGSMSQSVQEEKTWTTNGEEFTYSAAYTAIVDGVNPADRVTVVQMSQDHRELIRMEYLPGELPQSITPHPEAAYLIVEEIAAEEVTRTLHQPGGEGIRVFCRKNAIYCLPWYTEILWKP